MMILHMKNLHIRSFAKINISLNITKKREDGFHELDSVMLPISLHDSLVVSKLNGPDNFVTVDERRSQLKNCKAFIILMISSEF